MTPYTRIGIAVAAAVLIASSWQLHQRQVLAEEVARLREENSRLRREVVQRREARRAALPAGDTQVVSLSRAEATRARAEPVEVATPPSGALARGAAPAGRRSAANYRNEGQATPHATLQTFAWACDQGDAELMRRLLVFDDIARKKIEAHLAGLPLGARPTAPLEAMAAALYVSDGIQHPYPVAEVLAHARFESVSTTRMILRLPGANGDGYEFQQTADGWKVAVTEAVVEDYIRVSTARVSKP